MWTDGYVTDIQYTGNFFDQLSPTKLELLCLSAQLNWKAPSQKLTYLELGFGQGTSLNINAAVTPGHYWGTDFNPGHVANAMDLANASKADLTLLQSSFEELAAREDLPEFDVVVLHGVWSWVSSRNRFFITEILRKHLKPGGLCYVSYNTLPGWAGAGPLQTLLYQHALSMGSGNSSERLDAALKFADSVSKLNTRYFKEQPAALEKLASIGKHNRQYAIHEFFNAEWHPMPFGQVARELLEVQLSYGTQAGMHDQIDRLNWSQDVSTFLETITEPVLRETVKDYVLNRQFRRDIFIKGLRPLSSIEALSRWQEKKFTIVGEPNTPPKKVDAPVGRVSLDPKIYDPVIEALKENDFEPKTITAIKQYKSCKALNISKIIEAIRVLCGTAFVAPTQVDELVVQARKTAVDLNAELCRQAEFGNPSTHLAAPLIGTGTPVRHMEQIFMRAEARGVKDVPEYTWNLLKAKGERVNKDGKPLKDASENLSHLRQEYLKFVNQRRPLLERLGATCKTY